MWHYYYYTITSSPILLISLFLELILTGFIIASEYFNDTSLLFNDIPIVISLSDFFKNIERIMMIHSSNACLVFT